MSADREITRIVRSWLDEGVTRLPDRALDAVLDQITVTRQRRPNLANRNRPQRRTRRVVSFSRLRDSASRR